MDAMEDDLARLKHAWAEYALQPDCPEARGKLQPIMLRCVSRYPPKEIQRIEHEVYSKLLEQALKSGFT